jgi:RNA polymerase sigma factor (sigma-70 family)
MAPDSAIPPESFDEILAWLNPDRDVAGTIYVKLRDDLTKIFTWNRCPDPEGLTDEVFDRVARKVHDLRHTFVGDPKLYFYGVARNLMKEIPKRIQRQVSLEGAEPASNPRSELEQETATMRDDCLRSCLQRLRQEKRELILEYYAKDKQAKIDHRAEMARRLGISVDALRVKAYRIRETLDECIKRCLDRMAQNK